MIYAEAAYFDGYHVAHIAAYEDNNRLKAIDKRNRECFKQVLRERRSRNRANEESETEAKAASAANREDVRSLQARLYQQV